MILTEYNEELHARTLVEEGRREEREKLRDWASFAIGSSSVEEAERYISR